MARDPYAVLGVSRSASADELKRAYRKLSKELHPDRNAGNKEKEQRYKEVNEAYEILSDEKKRKMYDQFGTTGNAGSAGGGGNPFAGFDFSNMQGGDMGGFGDLFESFFGGGRGGTRRSERGSDMETEIVLEFSEVVTGIERTFSLRRQRACSVCGGTGAEKGGKLITCKECGGTGQVTRTTQSFFGAMRQSFVCPTCEGSGKMPEHPCKACAGEGRKEEKGEVKIHVPAGVQDGQSLRVRGEGGAGRHGAQAGDLYVVLRVRPDKRFERDGDDIRTTISVPVVDAILGTEIAVETVHGPVTLKVSAGTQPGQVLRLKGKGLPVLNSSRMGDHFVTVNVDIPAKLSHAERKLIEEWKNIRE